MTGATGFCSSITNHGSDLLPKSYCTQLKWTPWNALSSTFMMLNLLEGMNGWEKVVVVRCKSLKSYFKLYTRLQGQSRIFCLERYKPILFSGKEDHFLFIGSYSFVHTSHERRVNILILCLYLYTLQWFHTCPSKHIEDVREFPRIQWSPDHGCSGISALLLTKFSLFHTTT